MKIKHLVDLFYHKLNGPDDATAEDAMRVVVTALRDELGDPSTFKSAKQECCGRGVPNHSNTAEECCCLPDTWLLHEEFLGRINEILAPREGGSREAGGPTREDGRTTEAGFDSLPADVGPSTPAAPAPTVGQRLIKAAHEAAAIARGDMQPGRVHAASASVCEWKLSNEVGALGFRWLAEPIACGASLAHEGYAKALNMRCLCGLPIALKPEAQR